MHRKGVNPKNVSPEDILCDYCERPAWAKGIPCVEGHHGSVICGNCLTIAWVELIKEKITPENSKTNECSLCLTKISGPIWASKLTQKIACSTCIKRAAGVLHKDPDWAWTKP